MVLIPAVVILRLVLIVVVLVGVALFFSTQRLGARTRSGA
jgi:hypothetical protein